jgi:hypothetical protein
VKMQERKKVAPRARFELATLGLTGDSDEGDRGSGLMVISVPGSL